MMRRILLFAFPFLLGGCALFKSDEDKAVELIQQAKADIGLLNQNQTWLDFANNKIKAETNVKYIWKAEKTKEAGVFLVSFQDTAGWGNRWEVTEREKLVKLVDDNDYLCIKYGLSSYDKETPFKVSNIRLNSISVEKQEPSYANLFAAMFGPKQRAKKIVVYNFKADIKNTSDKFISDLDIKGELKLIFKEKTIVGTSGSSALSSSISRANPWKPGQTRTLFIKTDDIEKIYLNYRPEYAMFLVNLKAEDPIGYSYSKAVYETDLSDNWNKFRTDFNAKDLSISKK